MFSLRKKVFANLMLFTIISFVFMSILGIGVGMKMKDGQMSSCLFTAGQVTICQMNIVEHIAQWQQAFVGIPIKANFFALALLIIIASILFVKLFCKLEKLTKLTTQLFVYHKANFVKVFNSLLIAFSDGILNTKIYKLTHI